MSTSKNKRKPKLFTPKRKKHDFKSNLVKTREAYEGCYQLLIGLQQAALKKQAENLAAYKKRREEAKKKKRKAA